MIARHDHAGDEYAGRVHPRLEEWVAAGLSDAQIARRAHVNPRTVLRWRGALKLASQWRPAPPRHGTLARYQGTASRPPCRCADCRAANVVEQARLRRRYAAASRHAPRAGLPWSPQEDRELIAGAGTVLERARRLGRTYGAARQRLDDLRRDDPDQDARAG